MALTFTVYPAEAHAKIPEPEQVSSVAVFAVNEQGELLVAVHVRRGTDIVGGHVDPGETVLQALDREVDEEAGAVVRNPILIATVQVEPSGEKYAGKRMCIFAADNFTLNADWKPAPDVSDRGTMPLDKFLEQYVGDKKFMGELVALAKEKLKEMERARERVRETGLEQGGMSVK